MSDQDSDQNDEGLYKPTTAVYVKKLWVALAIVGRPKRIAMRSRTRDFNEFLKDNPEAMEVINLILAFNFFETVKVKVDVEGNQIEAENLTKIINRSPLFILPGHGEIKKTSDLAGKTDAESQSLRAQLEAGGMTHYLEDESGMIVKVELAKGDRIIDPSEITAVDLTQIQGTSVEPEPTPADEIDLTDDADKKKIN